MAYSNTHSTDLEGTTHATSQYWSITDAAQTGLDFSTTFTIAAWVKLESAEVNVRTLYSHRFSPWLTVNSTNFGLTLSSNGSTEQVSSASYSSIVGAWHHVAVTYDGGQAANSRVEMYLDGSALTVTEDAPSSLHDAANDVVVGQWYDVGERAWDGLINDMRVWARTLSSTEIGDLASTPCTFSNGSNFSAWWFINDTLSSSKAIDNSGNSNDLTNNNTATFSTDIDYTCPIGPANVKTWDGVAAASIKTIDGIDWANTA